MFSTKIYLLNVISDITIENYAKQKKMDKFNKKNLPHLKKLKIGLGDRDTVQKLIIGGFYEFILAVQISKNIPAFKAQQNFSRMNLHHRRKINGWFKLCSNSPN